MIGAAAVTFNNSLERKHDIDSLDCWCRPDFFLPCNECEDGEGCWKCERGLILISYNEAAESDDPLVIVHQVDT